MALTQEDHLVAAKAQLSRRKDELMAKVRELEDQMRTLDQIRQSLGVTLEEALESPAAPRGYVPVRTRHPLQDNIDRFVEEKVKAKGKTRFSPAEAKAYLEEIGHGGKWLYTSVYEALTKRVKDTQSGKADAQRKLWKDGTDFTLENPKERK